MRIAPATPPEVIKKHNDEVVTQVRLYVLITPLLGGGVKQGEVDPITTISGKAIRGQLRFWWRASRGGRYRDDLRIMKHDEDLLWGAAGTPDNPAPSQVQVSVEIVSKGVKEQPFVVTGGKVQPAQGWHVLAYAAFPIQPTRDEARSNVVPKSICKGVSFNLRISFPNNKKDDIEAALWAWETFGGIGARTRRGFGALRLASIDSLPVNPPSADSVETYILEGLRKHVSGNQWPEGVPHLTREVNSASCIAIRITPLENSALLAWQNLILKLKDFRQKRNTGSARNRPGRSKWPEPDEIRRLTGRTSSQHSNPISSVHKFPRAVLGLPIIFHFKDEQQDDLTLEGVKYNRLASPLILRPLACGSNQAVGLAMVLLSPRIPPEGLILKQGDKQFQVRADLTPAEAGSITPLGNQTDPLQAFLQHLTKEANHQ